MLFLLLYALLTPFPMIFIVNSNANNGRNPPFCPSLVILFINKEATGCIKEETMGAIIEIAKGVVITPRNPLSCFFYFMFFFSPSVAPSINRPEFSSNYDLNNIIYIFISLNKVNLFLALATPLVGNLGKTCLAKETAKSNNAFLYKSLIILGHP